MRQAKKLCKEMLIGIAVWTVFMMLFLGILAVPLSISPLSMLLGVLAGGLTAAGLLLHMYRHLDIALDLPPKSAGRHTQFSAFVRMFIMAGVMAVSFVFSNILHPAGVVFGILGLKASALFYPKLHRWFLKRGW